jgi:hypothetical protein
MVNVSDDDFFVYYVDLPDGITEAVLSCADGWTIYIDPRQSKAGLLRSYKHAVKHVNRDDFYKSNVGEIENEAHEKGG